MEQRQDNMQRRQNGFEKEQISLDDKLDGIQKTVTEIATVLIGIPGTQEGGLVEKVKCNSNRIRRVELIVAGILGSGALGGGIWSIIKFG